MLPQQLTCADGRHKYQATKKATGVSAYEVNDHLWVSFLSLRSSPVPLPSSPRLFIKCSFQSAFERADMWNKSGWGEEKVYLKVWDNMYANVLSTEPRQACHKAAGRGFIIQYRLIINDNDKHISQAATYTISNPAT